MVIDAMGGTYFANNSGTIMAGATATPEEQINAILSNCLGVADSIKSSADGITHRLGIDQPEPMKTDTCNESVSPPTLEMLYALRERLNLIDIVLSKVASRIG